MPPAPAEPCQSKFPSRAKRTCRIGEIGDMPQHSELFLCGRLVQFDYHLATGELRDDSGSIKLQFTPKRQEYECLRVGDIVQVAGRSERGRIGIDQIQVLVAGQESGMPSQNSSQPRWLELLQDSGQFQLLKLRSDFLQAVRRFFLEQNFIEIDAPSLVPAAGMEPHIEPFVTSFKSLDGREVRPYFLHNSPEYVMKKMLVAGYEKIFYLGHTFRNAELAPLHSPEFTMLEWYRAYSDYTTLMQDCRELVNYITTQLTLKWIKFWRQDDLLQRDWHIRTLSEIMRTACQFELGEIAASDRVKLLQIAQAKGCSIADSSWSLEDLFFWLFLQFVEPGLGKQAPLIVKEYPIWQASLAKCKAEDPRFVERFELYIDNVELANAFTELNDPEEQYQRLLAEQEQRRRNGRSEIPVDLDFIRALQVGMPPAAGIALGVDRLLMVCTGQHSIHKILPYSFQQ